MRGEPAYQSGAGGVSRAPHASAAAAALNCCTALHCSDLRDVQFYARLFAEELKRDPTDVELFDSAKRPAGLP